MPNQYEIPLYGSSAETMLGWLSEARQEGQAWLANQPGSKGWDQAMLTMGGPMTGGVTDQSQCDYPKVKRQSREMVASLSSFRHEGEFKVLWDDTLYDTAHLLTQLDRHWYKQCGAGTAYRQAAQYAVNFGTAYLYETWDPVFWSADRGDIRLQALSPADVTFVQMPKDNDIQKAYMVIIRQEMPINLAKHLWMRSNPAFAHGLVPDREQPSNSALMRGLQKVQQFMSPALRAAGRTGQNDNSASFPTVDIYTAYTMDSSINMSPDPVRMGVYGTNWTYVVPSLGSPMPTGIKNPATGEDFTVPAKESDCLMFPLRRMTIWASSGVGYDGSSPWWHGEAPVARLWFNDVPWNGLGGSITADVESMETGIVETMRLIEDSVAARMDPPALYDENMAGSWAEQINPRKAGVRAKAPLSQIADPIKYPFPPQYYDVPLWIMNWIEAQEGRMDYITGVRDLVAMAKAKQIPSSDTLEKLMEMAGPIVQDMVRAFEEPLAQLGQWRKAYYFQFYNEPRIISTVGPDDGAEQLSTTEFITTRLKDLLYRRVTSVNAAGDEVFSEVPRSSFKFTPSLLSDSREKSKRLISEFVYEVTQSGINEISRMTQQLLYIQLSERDFPISPWTMAKVMRVPNFGPPPAGTNTEMERWIAWRRMKLELDVELAAEAQAAGSAMGAIPGAGGVATQEPGSAPEGRPPSFKKPPTIQQKDHGTRSTIATS